MAQLKSAAPVEAGMSAERLAHAAGLLKAEVDSGKLGAAAILVAHWPVVEFAAWIDERSSRGLSPGPLV